LDLLEVLRRDEGRKEEKHDMHAGPSKPKCTTSDGLPTPQTNYKIYLTG
jgi:hypothetical protein